MMKINHLRNRTLRKVAIVGLCALALIARTLSLRAGNENVNIEKQAMDQKETVEMLSERLRGKGVPVKSVTLVSEVPFKAEINLQSNSKNSDFLLHDGWYMQLSRNEATLAYIWGTKLDGYVLTVYNPENMIISREGYFIYPEDYSQNIVIPNIKSLSGSVTKASILSNLDLGDI